MFVVRNNLRNPLKPWNKLNSIISRLLGNCYRCKKAGKVPGGGGGVFDMKMMGGVLVVPFLGSKFVDWYSFVC